MKVSLTIFVQFYILKGNNFQINFRWRRWGSVLLCSCDLLLLSLGLPSLWGCTNLNVCQWYGILSCFFVWQLCTVWVNVFVYNVHWYVWLIGINQYSWHTKLPISSSSGYMYSPNTGYENAFNIWVNLWGNNWGEYMYGLFENVNQSKPSQWRTW